MQFKYLHKGFYKLYPYACKHERLANYAKKYQSIVDKWDFLKDAGTDVKRIPEFVGISRATYYRAKKILPEIKKGK